MIRVAMLVQSHPAHPFGLAKNNKKTSLVELEDQTEKPPPRGANEPRFIVFELGSCVNEPTLERAKSG